MEKAAFNAPVDQRAELCEETPVPAPTSPPKTVLVHLPSQLRERTRMQSTAEVVGGSVRELILALDQTFPGLRFNICTEDGELRTFVNIFVDGRNVRYSSGLDTPVAAGSVVHILHSVAGG